MRTPVTLLDPLGFTFYVDDHGESLFPADEYDIRLVTHTELLPAAIGDALTSVVGVPSFEPGPWRDAALFVSRSGGVTSKRMVALTERLLLPCAELREELGIVGDTVRHVLRFRDKVLMKEHLGERGIRVPSFAAYSRDAAEALLGEFGKIVAKPRGESESIGFTAISNPAELDDFEAGHADRLEDFEVEEFIAGKLFHVDSVVERSRVVAVSAGHSPEPNASYEGRGRHYCDVEVPPGPLFDRLVDFNERVVSCYPDHSGVTHLEVFVTEHEIVFCEIAGRFGGGGVRAGFLARTGIDLAHAMIAGQLGRPIPQPTRRAEELSGFTAVTAPDGTRRRPIVLSEPWIIDSQIYADPGRDHRARLAAVVTVRGRNEDEVYQRLRSVQATVCEAYD